MSSISYPRIVRDVADAYRSVSCTTDRIKYGKLAEKIQGLNIGGNVDAVFYTEPIDLSAEVDITREASLFQIISNMPVELTGTVDGKAAAGHVIGLSSDKLDLTAAAKQWQMCSNADMPTNLMAYDAGTVVCKLSSRTYTKAYDGEALIGCIHINLGYTGPLLVSRVSSSAVAYCCNGNTYTSPGYFIYNDTMYWYNSGDYWQSSNYSDSSGLQRQKFTANSMQEGAIMLIEAANANTWQNIEGETGSTLTADSSYENIRCTLTGRGKFMGTAITPFAKTE